MSLPKEALELLGTKTDKAISNIYNVPIQLVHSIRREMGIDPYRKHSVTHLKKLNQEEFDSLRGVIGTDKDTIIARQFDVSREYIRQLRVKYNIPKFSK